MRGKDKASETFSVRDSHICTADAILLQQALVPGKSSPAHSYHDDGEILYSFFRIPRANEPKLHFVELCMVMLIWAIIYCDFKTTRLLTMGIWLIIVINLQSKLSLVAFERPRAWAPQNNKLEGKRMDLHLSRLLDIVYAAVLILLIRKCLFLWRLLFNGCLRCNYVTFVSTLNFRWLTIRLYHPSVVP